MILAPIHLDYWRCAKTTPRWSKRIRSPGLKPSVDRVINAHAGIRLTNSEMEANNLLVILQTHRKLKGARGMLNALADIAQAPGCAGHHMRRAGWCKKWLKRIYTEQACRAFA